jgi:hypothetical protein
MSRTVVLTQEKDEDEKEDHRGDEDEKDDHLGVHPIHWEWMSLDIPLEDLPPFLNLVDRFADVAEGNSGAHSLTMSFFRQLLAGMCSELRIRQSRANEMHIKFVGTLGTIFTTVMCFLFDSYLRSTAEHWEATVIQNITNMTHVIEGVMVWGISNMTHNIENVIHFP